MLGKTAGGLYWMFRYLERAENTARLIEAGFRIALTRSNDAEAEWKSVILTSAVLNSYEAVHDGYDSARVVDYLLRDERNSSSVLSGIKAARDNARLVRTALTAEVWLAVNDTWMLLSKLLRNPVPDTELPAILATIRQQSALVRGALNGTMLRNDIYDFCRLGTMIERMDNTARIVNVKHYALLPSKTLVGSRIDNVQWETLLRSVSAHSSFRWAVEEEYTPSAIANFLILDMRLPRSISFCAAQIVDGLASLDAAYSTQSHSCALAKDLSTRIRSGDISQIFDEGLHNFIGEVITSTAKLAGQIEKDYRFVG